MIFNVGHRPATSRFMTSKFTVHLWHVCFKKFT